MSYLKPQYSVASIKRKYPPGTHIILDSMDEIDMPPGLKGIVKHVDDQGTIHMIWENGRTLGVIPGEDKFHVIPIKMEEMEIGNKEQQMER